MTEIHQLGIIALLLCWLEEDEFEYTLTGYRGVTRHKLSVTELIHHTAHG